MILGLLCHPLLMILGLLCQPEIDHYQNCRNDGLASFNKWIKTNRRTLSYDKTSVIKFCIDSRTWINLNVGYDEKQLKCKQSHLLTFKLTVI
jgi:hypothetical protein